MTILSGGSRWTKTSAPEWSGVNSHYLLPNAGRTERSHQTTASPETCPTGEDRSTSARASGQGRLKLHDNAAEWP